MKKTKNSKSKKGSMAKMYEFGMGIVGFPAKLVSPVRVFLLGQLKKLKKTRKEISNEDPFKNSARIPSNAAPDTEAEEQFGHAMTSAIKEQLDKRIIQTRKALTMIKLGKYGICEDCGKMIDTDRLIAFPDATLCAKDQAKREK